METLIKFLEWWLTKFPDAVDARLDKMSLRGYGLEAPLVTLVWLVFFFWLFAHPAAASTTGAILAVTLPFVLPFRLWDMYSEARLEYWKVRKFSETKFALLEIKLPEDLTQTPYAMELVLRSMYQTGGATTPYHAYYGDVNAQFSLEIVSDGGRIHFYIWCRDKLKALVESQIYAHYPTVQVVEVPDYTLKMPFDAAALILWGVEFSLQKPDPWPIITYKELGLDKPGIDEENKHDPIASVLEFLGTAKQGEHIWVQMNIRAHDKGMSCAGKAPIDPKTGKPVGIEEWAKIEVQAIADKFKPTAENDFSSYMRMTAGDRKNQEMIQEKLNKQLFEVGIRTVYIAKKEDADRGKTPFGAGLPSIYRSFEHGSAGRGLNGLAPVFWNGPFNFPWHDFMNLRRHMLMERYYDAYVTRQFFQPPHKHPHIVLNTEELASLYHFPGKVVATPTLQRMPSKRAEAPSNLPV